MEEFPSFNDEDTSWGWRSITELHILSKKDTWTPSPPSETDNEEINDREISEIS